MTIKIISDRQGRFLCPMNHQWQATLTIADCGIQRREGKRPARYFNYSWPKCPTCKGVQVFS